jgi:hypothetical protein
VALGAAERLFFAGAAFSHDKDRGKMPLPQKEEINFPGGKSLTKSAQPPSFKGGKKEREPC